MKKCIRCGADLPDNAGFCSNCGAQQPPGGADRGQPEYGHASGGGNQPGYDRTGNAGGPGGRGPSGFGSGGGNGYPGGGMPVKKGIRKYIPLIAGACAAVAAVLIVLAILRSRPATIDLEKYVSIETSGYDGYGEVNSVYDYEALNRAILSALAKKGEISKSLQSQLERNDYSLDSLDTLYQYGSVYQMMVAIGNSYSIDYDDIDNLSNGDTVTVEFSYDNEEIKQYKIRFKGDKVEQTVDNLTKVKTFDAFKNVEVLFNGMNGSGTVEIDAPDAEEQELDYLAEPYDGLSNGDTVTVTVSPYGSSTFDQDYIGSHGQAPEETTKEFEVSGLSGYLAKMEDLTEDAVNNMKSQAQDILKAELASNYDSDQITLNSLNYSGAYLLTAKDSESSGDANKLYLVYRENLTIAPSAYGNDQSRTFDLYTCVRFQNISVRPDGTVEVDLNAAEQSSDWYGYVNSVPLDGYGTESELETDVITSQTADYSVQSTFTAG